MTNHTLKKRYLDDAVLPTLGQVPHLLVHSSIGNDVFVALPSYVVKAYDLFDDYVRDYYHFKGGYFFFKCRHSFAAKCLSMFSYACSESYLGTIYDHFGVKTIQKLKQP